MKLGRGDPEDGLTGNSGAPLFWGRAWTEDKAKTSMANKETVRKDILETGVMDEIGHGLQPELGEVK